MTGKVFLVGAGPGDPGLITVKGLQLLRQADAVIYDRLAAPELLEEIRPEAERYYAGRARGMEMLSQPKVNALLVELAQAGKQVVRLKGGDPFVFGRGGEEGDACARAGIPFEVVPGVSSAIAVPAYAGIPLTHRDVASTFAVITGHEAQDRPEARINWPQLATGIDTLVILMAVAELPGIVRKLIQHGRPPTSPAAIISQGTRTEQCTIVTTLAELPLAASGVRAPAIVVVGEVVRLREQLRWFD
jgi:uroporphyrinogen III methyltransferase / synthase